ncbi:hypothetical protein Ocin01_12179 [Orchesella cincta]|uniref:Uncharacterized protein n=1 Tax=Orchesella cincta TaxID=48709 RepID=A0A1D2MNC5_ORCCI|nr:hypothetical protein Ocin01_12179 [Orchesella cincta]
MNAHMMAQMGENLRWTSFPNNAKDLLGKIEHFYFSCKANNMMWKPEILIDSINQFVYNVVDARDIKRTKLSASQQLQLADIIVNYLSFSGDETDRQALFNSIFYSINFQKGDVPLRILGLVTSLSVAFRKSEILQCIAVWITAASLENPAVLCIAYELSRDLITDEFPDKYQNLPQRSYLFSAVFLIAVGKAYKSIPPPQRLIDQVTVWIENCPRVCFIPPQSAIFEIFRWCAHSEEDQSRLHLALMSAIDRAGKGAQLQVIPHIMTLIQELRVKREHVVSANNNGGLAYAQVERGVDMLFQLIQMLLASECLDRNEIHPIFESSEEALLPRTELYDMLKSIYFR